METSTESGWPELTSALDKLLSVLHTAVGQDVHLRGRPWLYYVYEHT
jgi:hypothetical protein